MYCKNCGKEIFPDQNICSNCGAQQQPIQEKDSGGFGYGVLGFFFPFIGLILFLVLRESKPNTAKAAGIGALIPIVLPISYIFLTGFSESLGALAFLILGLFWI